MRLRSSVTVYCWSLCNDKAGRSIPAPGRGALTITREVHPKHRPPVLDVGYRARQVSFRRKQIGDWLAFEQEQLKEDLDLRRSKGKFVDPDFFASPVADLEVEACRQEKDVVATYGTLMQSSEGADPCIAPLRRALTVWGLTTDDIGVLSIHGTSTQSKEKDETYMWNTILKTLDRISVPIMAQKSSVGHSKGGAAAWQIAGLQSIGNGAVPGNCNADLARPCRRALPTALIVDVPIQVHSGRWYFRWYNGMLTLALFRYGGDPTHVVVIIRFWPGWRTALVVYSRYVLLWMCIMHTL